MVWDGFTIREKGGLQRPLEREKRPTAVKNELIMRKKALQNTKGRDLKKLAPQFL